MSGQANDSTIITKLAWGGAGSGPTMLEANQVHSFKDLISEDLARELQKREQDIVLQQIALEKICISPSVIRDCNDTATSSDLILAHMLQEQFNKDFNSQIQREENHFNKNSKISVSLDKYKVYDDSGSSNVEDLPELDENREVDSFQEREQNEPVIPSCGYIRHNNEIITKHDRNISGRRNAERIMDFPPGINTGDGGEFPMEISNKVFNKLHQSAKLESKRKFRVKDKCDKAITDKALDVNTKLIVYKMLNNCVLGSVNGVISTGKESVVFHAQGGTTEEETFPDECAIKVFKTTLTDFKTREKYIRNDYRFKDRFSKSNNKTMIKMWAEKEFHNLKRLQKANIPAPLPVMIRQHVLVMSFVGHNHIAADKLKDVRLSFAEWCVAYEQVVEIMVKMFRACRLVHGDLSEYNILWHNDQCWVIDVSQSVEPTHPQALTFLLRDCSNIVEFFNRKGVTGVSSRLELFKQITGIHLSHDADDDENIVEEYEVNQELWKQGLESNSDCFEYLWKDDDIVQVQEEQENTHMSPREKTKKKRRSKKKNKSLVVSTDGEFLSQ